jgi:hypothetical protein
MKLPVYSQFPLRLCGLVLNKHMKYVTFVDPLKVCGNFGHCPSSSIYLKYTTIRKLDSLLPSGVSGVKNPTH